MTSSKNSPVGLLVRLISDAAAPLAGLSAATLAYSAAAMLPVWLPLALGRGRRSAEERLTSRSSGLLTELLASTDIADIAGKNTGTIVARPSYGHRRGGRLRRLPTNSRQSQKLTSYR